jgi:undecaprenyl-diphosphatase
MSIAPAPRSIVFAHPPLSPRAILRMAAGAIVLVLLGLALGAAVQAASPLPVEEQALEVVAEQRAGWLTGVMRAVSAAGHLRVFLPLAILAVPLLRVLGRGWEAPWLFVLAFLGSLAVTAAVKVAVDRERPLEALIEATSAAFPSGHASRAAAVGGLAVWAVLALVRSRAVRAVAVALLLGVVALMGASRLYLGVHWPSDILFGYGLGFCWVAVLLHAVQPRVRPAAAVPEDEPQITGPPAAPSAGGLPPGTRRRG